jgi:hypothetical protein
VIANARQTFRASLVVALLACGEARTDHVGDAAKPAAPAPPAPAPSAASPYTDTVRIQARVDSIDAYVTEHPDRLKLYAAVPGDSTLVPVKDSTAWPDETDATYNIMFDSANRPLVHVEMPTSESGDWFAVGRHWFAPDGRTILYELSMSGFGSGCGEILRETWRVYLDPAGSILKESRRYTDGNDAPVVADTCYRRSEDAPPPKRSASELPFPK